MRYPKINEFIAVDTTDLRKKTTEELLEVKICNYFYINHIKLTKEEIYKVLEEWEDLAQIIKTFSYALLIHIHKSRKLNLSVGELYKCTENKLKYINCDINHNQLEEMLNSSFDFVQNAIRIICINHDIKREDSFNRHLQKLKSRGYSWDV